MPLPRTNEFNSNALRVLLDKCRTLCSVKAWGIRGGGLSATASLRLAYEARGIDLACAVPLPLPLPSPLAPLDDDPERIQELPLLPEKRHAVGVEPKVVREEGGGEDDQQGLQIADGRISGSGGGEESSRGTMAAPCVFGCGALVEDRDAVDHVEVRLLIEWW